ncbi:hypothetical protein OEG86_17650 [Hoeflea alexandrii]|uniref:vWA domain-containing protein n=1 Tax=Hoeflea alexandrii TaxID=288436 RepID=UPI00226D8EF4|nr:hypothetical protein [Hoeflea alexandrii]MCY0153743.1 hypothetical protein [Hoeflea alexandrii]
MRFQGRTPLSDAVRRAAEELRFTENPATVVLVTDGIETCNADPCALGKELEQSGVEFTAHVVGFGLTRQEGLELSCLARNTGGSYFDASDREGLGKALDQAIKTAAPAATPAAPEPEPVQPEATLDAADSAAITSAVEVTWTATRSERDYIDVAPLGAPAFEWASWVELGDSDTVMLRMPPEPGDYVIRYIAPDAAEPVVASRPIKVVEGDFVLDGPLTVQVGESFRVNWRGPEGEENYIDIMEKGSTATENEPSYAWTRDGNPAELMAPITAERVPAALRGAGRERTRGRTVGAAQRDRGQGGDRGSGRGGAGSRVPGACARAAEFASLGRHRHAGFLRIQRRNRLFLSR